MKHVLYFLLSTLCLISTKVAGQNIVRDSQGQSAIGLNPGYKGTGKEEKKDEAENKKDDKKSVPNVDTVRFNLGIITFATSEKKIELNHYSYFANKKIGTMVINPFFIGVAASGEIKNSIGSVFSDGNIVGGAEAKLRFGYRIAKTRFNADGLYEKQQKRESKGLEKLSKDEIQEFLDEVRPLKDLWFVANGGFTGSAFKLFYPDSTFAKQIQKQNFTGYEVGVGFNTWWTRIGNCQMIAGATIGIKSKNNFEDLSESTREDTRVVNDSATNTTRKIVTKETVYTGKYTERIVYPLNLDLYLVPYALENLGFLVYSRTYYTKHTYPKSTIGFGVFFLKDQNAFNPTAGITFDYMDTFNVDKTDDYKPSIKKITISITTRINLVNNFKRQ